MKKIIKVTGIVLLVIAGLIAALVVGFIIYLLIKAAFTQIVPADYTEAVKTGGVIEATYLRNGSHKVSYFEQKVDVDFEKFEVWYPEDLEKMDGTYPLIVVLNGTGVTASKCKAQFEHFASWGFVVIGTEELDSWDGFAAERSLAFMMEQNENPSGIFYHKIDTSNIGAVGQFKGGVGVFNAITEFKRSSLYKTAVPICPVIVNEQQTISLGLYYDLSEINIPVFLLAGTKGDTEMEMVLPDDAMTEMYNKITAPKVMARKLDCGLGDMLYSADGYVTAWFMWQLQEDSNAARAFIGDQPELLTNSLYEKQQFNFSE